MNEYDLLEAIDSIDDKSIESAGAKIRTKLSLNSKALKRWGLVAACIIALAAISGVLFFPRRITEGPSGTVIKLDASAPTKVNGTASKYIGDISASTAMSAPPMFGLSRGIIVVAKAVEELPDPYQTLNEYGSVKTVNYRIFKMKVLNGLDSGMPEEFLYALPANLKGDLTKYDALIISMVQSADNYILKNMSTNKLTLFDVLFYDISDNPELGNITAFTDNIFDESLWQDESWYYGYQFARGYLDGMHGLPGDPIFYRGSTLDYALEKLQKRSPEVFAKLEFISNEAKAVAEYVKHFENGIFNPTRYPRSDQVKYQRYIGGCPTNEWIWVNYGETVKRTEYSFTNHDLDKLYDIAAYIDSVDLSSVKPMHTNVNGKRLLNNSIMGWYEKTEKGVYSIVKISWRYCDESNYFKQYIDETFILLENNRARLITRNELIKLIGKNANISEYEYGVRFGVPME